MDAAMREALLALDITPQTVDDLAARLDWEHHRVEAVLKEGVQQGLVIDWSPDYATSWKAKRELFPRFFQRALPASLAVGLVCASAFLLLTPTVAVPVAREAAAALVLLGGVAAIIAGRA